MYQQCETCVSEFVYKLKEILKKIFICLIFHFTSRAFKYAYKPLSRLSNTIKKKTD